MMKRNVPEHRHPLLDNLACLFNPASIACIGATEFSMKWGFLVFNNLLAGGYRGGLYPVNPGRESVEGIKAYPSVRDIPGPVDLALFSVPAPQVLQAMDDCVAKGVRAAMIITAGFKELGAEWAELERELVRKARRGGIVVAGPNGQGMSCPANRLYLWMPLFFPPGGRVAFVAQSGNVLNLLIEASFKAGSGVSKAVSSGNEADLRMEDYFTWLADDPDTDAIAAYAEGTPDARRFFALAREVTARKPVVLMRGGRTGSGSEAARSHTGAMAVSDELFDAACRQAGIIRARSIEEAGVIASSFVDRPLPRGRRVAIVTSGGGLGVIAADLCTAEGLEVVRLSDETLRRAGELLPDWWVPGNPIDLVAGLDLSVPFPLIDLLMRSGEVDAVLFTFVTTLREAGVRTPPGLDRIKSLSEVWDGIGGEYVAKVPELYGLMRETGIPLYVTSNLVPVRNNEEDGDEGPPYRSGTSTYADLAMACRAVAEMAGYCEWRRAHRTA
jgi:acyl-CoA synthetase (NDP forming)